MCLHITETHAQYISQTIMLDFQTKFTMCLIFQTFQGLENVTIIFKDNPPLEILV